MEPGYKTVDHIEQLDFSKLIGGPKVDFFDMILSSGPKEVTVDLERHLVDRNCRPRKTAGLFTAGLVDLRLN